ncbi:MAG: hypothetical protein HYW64_01940 [Candidatus Levybacteria bacterium]|nr:hypothetical protein [Candidatus Levybacteria bacterium]
MTLPPAEQPKPPEAATPEEIIVPKNIIRPATEPLDQIRSLISSLPTGLSQQEQEQVDEIKSAPQSIISTLEALRTAREVKVSVKSDQHYEIEYSEEKEEEEIPREGQILVDKSTAHPLVIATFDRLGNYCARLMYAELLHRS